jgi:hypothetical protein
MQWVTAVAFALACWGCGGVAEVHSGSSSNDGGTADTARNPNCPKSVPADGSQCSNFVECEYRTAGVPEYCTTLASCELRNDGSPPHWTVAPPAKECVVRAAECPSLFPGTDGAPCGVSSSIGCYYSEGGCHCVQQGCPPLGPSVWSCVPWAVGCPSPQPLLGEACPTEGLECGGYCGASLGGSRACVNGYWDLGTEAPCISCPVQ